MTSTARTSARCKAQCTKPTGGIFRNGQFVNATDVKSCIAYLASQLKIGVDVSATASGSSECGDEGCSGEGSASVKAGGCAAAPGSNNGVAGALGLVAGLGLVSAVLARRRARSTR